MLGERLSWMHNKNKTELRFLRLRFYDAQVKGRSVLFSLAGVKVVGGARQALIGQGRLVFIKFRLCVRFSLHRKTSVEDGMQPEKPERLQNGDGFGTANRVVTCLARLNPPAVCSLLRATSLNFRSFRPTRSTIPSREAYLTMSSIQERSTQCSTDSNSHVVSAHRVSNNSTLHAHCQGCNVIVFDRRVLVNSEVDLALGYELSEQKALRCVTCS